MLCDQKRAEPSALSMVPGEVTLQLRRGHPVSGQLDRLNDEVIVETQIERAQRAVRAQREIEDEGMIVDRARSNRAGRSMRARNRLPVTIRACGRSKCAMRAP